MGKGRGGCCCCDDEGGGIPNDNVPLFVSHLILIVLSSAAWVLCAPIIHDGWPTHIHAWIVFELSLAVVQTAFGILGAVVDSRDATFYERKPETFLLVDVVLFVMNVAVSVTGAVYWRRGSEESHVLFDCVVVLSWLTLAVLGLAGAQDYAKTGSD